MPNWCSTGVTSSGNRIGASVFSNWAASLVSAEYTPHWSPYYPKWKINIYSVPNKYLTAAQEILFDGAMADLADRLKSMA